MVLIRWYSPNDTNADDENIWYIRAAIFCFCFCFGFSKHTHTMTMKERLRFGQCFGLVMTFLNNKEDLIILSSFLFLFVVVGGKDY